MFLKFLNVILDFTTQYVSAEGILTGAWVATALSIVASLVFGPNRFTDIALGFALLVLCTVEILYTVSEDDEPTDP